MIIVNVDHVGFGSRADRRAAADRTPGSLRGGGPSPTLWTAADENPFEKVTQIVLVIDNYEGGYVWELGYLYHEDIREKVWVLEREYDSEEIYREHYDNGMAASRLQLLENADRARHWMDENGLEAKTDEILRVAISN